MDDQVQLEKISHVEVYTAMCENAQECWDVLQLVRDAGIPHRHLNWHDETCTSDVIEPMKQWSLFDGEKWFEKNDLCNFPFVKWECLYDDVTIRTNLAAGKEELLESQLWKNLDKVK